MAVDENGKVTFTPEEQAKVDEIVKDRLARHKPEDYEDLKEIEKILEEFDFTGTPAEKKEALKVAREAKKQSTQADSYKDAVQAYKGVDELPPDTVIKALAKKWGKDPETVEKAFQKQIDAMEESDKKTKEDEEWGKQIKEFEEKHKDIDLEKLSQNAKFVKFAKGKRLSLVELYEDFVDFVGEQEKELDTLRKTVQAKEANEKNAGASTGSVKGDNPTGDFISRDTFEKHKNDRQWVMKNLETITKSRAKW